MKMKTTVSLLLACTALVSTPADAKARKHSTARHHTVDPRDAEIKALEAKVDALTQRLDAQEAAQQATAQQAQSAQAAAAAAQSQATNAIAQTQAAQAQVAKVENQVPPLEKAIKTGWFANTSISGKGFVNVSNISHKRNGVDQTDNGTETELKRFYIGIDHKFTEVFSANVTTDFRYNANGTSNDVLVYLKKAYLQAKLNPAFILRVGEADLPWVPFDEGLYGYRFVENTLIDRTKFGTSSDWGVHVLGTLGPNSLVTYQVSAINGSGYKTLARNSDTIDLEARVSVNPVKPITLAVGGYTGKLGKSADNGATTHRATRFNALAAYTDKRIRAGVEYFAAKNWNNVNTVATDKSNGWSAFGSFAVTQQIAAFGRYDWVKPNRDTNPALHDHYFNVGVDFKPIPPLDLALVYKRDRANNGFLATSNGTIGGVNNLTDGTYNEIGLFGQFVF
jgi:Phosphate-selective porin O and P